MRTSAKITLNTKASYICSRKTPSNTVYNALYYFTVQLDTTYLHNYMIYPTFPDFSGPNCAWETKATLLEMVFYGRLEPLLNFHPAQGLIIFYSRV